MSPHRRLLALPVVVLSAAALVACSDAAATNAEASATASGSGGSGGASASSGGTTGAGAGVACEPGSHPVASGACEATLAEWTEGPALTETRDHHLTAVVEGDGGASLYVLGGVRNMSTLLSSAERAPIAADGSLGAWSPASKLPAGMAGAAIATVGDTIVINGGFRTGPPFSSKSERAAVQADGSLGPWSEGPLMSVGRFHHAMVSHGDSLYVTGGLSESDSVNTDSVERAVVAADGSIAAWTALTSLPESRSHHGLATDGVALYASGGISLDANGVRTDLTSVVRAELLPDGTIGPWVPAGELPVALATHSSFVFLGYLYVVGGLEDFVYDTDHVRRAPIGELGTLGAWEDLPPIPIARAHAHQTPLYRGFLYSAGGAQEHVSIDDVFVGRFE